MKNIDQYVGAKPGSFRAFINTDKSTERQRQEEVSARIRASRSLSPCLCGKKAIIDRRPICVGLDMLYYFARCSNTDCKKSNPSFSTRIMECAVELWESYIRNRKLVKSLPKDDKLGD